MRLCRGPKTFSQRRGLDYSLGCGHGYPVTVVDSIGHHLQRLDVRTRLAINPSLAYLQNLILPSTAILPPRNKSQRSLAIRCAIVTQTGAQQVRSLMRIARASFAAADSMVIACTNWSKARLLYCVDFSTAVVPSTSASSQWPKSALVRLGGPTTYWGTILAVNDSPRDAFIIYRKSDAGDYWLNGFLRRKTWALIEAEFKQYWCASG